MSKQSEAVKRWRQNAKRKLIIAFGGKCAICGYDKCDDALEFHHVDPSEKEFGWGQLRSNIKSMEVILVEMMKCVMLCSNCHSEVHSLRSTTIVPSTARRLTEDDCQSILDGSHEGIPKDSCPVCGALKPEWQSTCSRACAYTYSAGNKIPWHTLPCVLTLLETMSYEQIAEHLGVSAGAVSRRMDKIDPTKERRTAAISQRSSNAITPKQRVVDTLDSKQPA